MGAPANKRLCVDDATVLPDRFAMVDQNAENTRFRQPISIIRRFRVPIRRTFFLAMKQRRERTPEGTAQKSD
jgi:hypothetical protein